jgi:ElaB/YqjD/DUF883 family membrane-anchored ribosome-binding protein
MDKKMEEISNDMRALTEDARALIAATADMAGEKVSKARERLAAALDNCKELYGHLREKAVDSVKAADQTLHERPYQAIGFMVGAGAVIGYLIARRCFRNGDSPVPDQRPMKAGQRAVKDGVWNSK